MMPTLPDLPTLIDTHCHLDLAPLADDVPGALTRARAAGVTDCVTIGTTLEASRTNIAIATEYRMCHAAVGVHPHNTSDVTEEVLCAIEELSHAPQVVAIGEVGLDNYRNHSTPADQQRALRAFVPMAQQRELPIIIHCRDAYDDLLSLLRDVVRGSLRGIIHCASGPGSFITAALELGLHISFAGNVTFPKAQALRDLVPLVPDDRLLLETDAPYLAPQPTRGRPNEPAYVAHTATCIAEVRGTTVAAVGAMTSANARMLFRLPAAAALGDAA